MGSDKDEIRHDSKKGGERAREEEQRQRDAGNGQPPNNRGGVSNDTPVRPKRD